MPSAEAERSRMVTRRAFLTAVAALAVPSACASPDAVAARPAEVLLMRHAEKHEKNPDIHLSEEGRARAVALPKLFPARFAAPEMLFAARASKLSDHSVETLEPLARALGLRIDDTFADRDYAQLAAAILSRPDCANRHILVCWHHETLPELVTALGASPPAKWPDKQYDHIWQVRFTARGAVATDLRERLMPGDSDVPSW
jgi:phosphohistidine phosphatase SixA